MILASPPPIVAPDPAPEARGKTVTTDPTPRWMTVPGFDKHGAEIRGVRFRCLLVGDATYHCRRIR